MHPGNLDADDVTILLLRPNVLTGRVGLGDKARAMGKFAREIVRGMAALPDFKLANIGGAIFPPLSRQWRGSGEKPAATPPLEKSR
jgi:hypothetical protein